MLLTPDKYRAFTPLPIADARSASAVILCLSQGSRDAVDATIDAGVAAGGSADPARRQDYGTMYGRSLLDPDGHHFEFMWMDPAAAQAPAAFENA
jgi:predicted lactoylglutathione lyase